ncbi:CotH kinase family protein [Sphingobacterium faecium]|uniref:CotH kinase family protein n=1 Tax=Sphingobacterium faecium TaxID=34087 RepID=UPI003209C13F
MKRIVLLFSLFILLLDMGCVKNKDLYRPPVSIVLSTATIEMDHAGGKTSFTIKSNYPWKIKGSTPDCTLSALSGSKDQEQTVQITVAENFDEERIFNLTIEADKEQKILAVKQKGKNYAKSAADIQITSFDILPLHNQNIHIPISFVKNGQFAGDQQISYYQTDLTNLISSWTSNAVKVTLKNVVQSSGETTNNYNNDLIFRFYAQDNSYKDYTIKLKNAENASGLPLLVLNTDDGKDITSKEIWSMGNFKLDPQNNKQVVALTGITEIKGRGNSTWGLPKKPYALKLQDKSTGTFMGMKAHKRWVLLANHADKTSLRNRVAFELGKKLGLAWTPDSRFVEVILNGKFLGNYLLTEQIKIDSKRVNIEEVDNKETDVNKITGGWLMEIDRYYSNGETRYFRPELSQLPIIVKEPEDANSAQMNYINTYFNTLEQLIYPTLPKGTPYHKGNTPLAGIPDSAEYGKYIDINSFINYWLVQELTENRDSRLPGSVYMYKGTNKKLSIGPLWDFDQTTFTGSSSWLHYDYTPSANEYTALEYRSLYYSQLFKDPKFKSKAKERWKEIYPTLLNDIPLFIDREYNLIGKSLDLNWIDIGENNTQGIWALTNEEMSSGGRNHDKNLKSKDAVDRLKSFYIRRVNWMNTEINKW